MTTHRYRSAARTVLGLATLTALVAGCSSPTEADQQAPTTSGTSTPTADVAAGPGEVVVSGDVRNPTTLTSDALRALPQHTRTAAFESSTGSQSHTYDGAALFDIISAADPAVDMEVKNPLLAVAVAATGADGYTATIAWGEMSPDFAATEILVAHTEDGAPLDRPRLVAPGDIKGGRYVGDLIQLHVVDLAPDADR
ncbi:MAG: molybdopterin-dependent oxidoreductase [Rhodococcus sp. (in: high G+C Gram-positive bacteria)]|uniref:molybdopterin-dependent oxidoreductase n=1 Tax=Rhodococcus sp. TaxID=1831 RepID=UPI003BB68AD5